MDQSIPKLKLIKCVNSGYNTKLAFHNPDLGLFHRLKSARNERFFYLHIKNILDRNLKLLRYGFNRGCCWICATRFYPINT